MDKQPLLISSQSCVEIVLASGVQLAGQVPATSTYVPGRGSVVLSDDVATHNGLIMPERLFRASSGQRVRAVRVVASIGAANVLTVAVTSGLGDGTADSIDNPANDVVLGTITASGTLELHINDVQLLGGQNIRLTTSMAAPANGRIAVFLQGAALA